MLFGKDYNIFLFIIFLGLLKSDSINLLKIVLNFLDSLFIIFYLCFFSRGNNVLWRKKNIVNCFFFRFK